MKVLVTGGAGKVGKHVVRELLHRGHQVTAAGRSPEIQLSNDAQYVSLDCVDFERVKEVVQGCDAVIHLAAVPSPTRDTSERIFQINCGGIYNVYQACAEACIDRVAVASSINALGMGYGRREVPIRYFPIDEDHPVLCSDAYSFSKKMTEEIGEFFWQRDHLSSVVIRIPAVVECQEPDGRLHFNPRKFDRSGPIHNLWTWIDARDCARVFADGIEKPYQGFHVLFANDNVNNVGIPSRELAARFFPHVSDWRENIEGCQSLISCKRAKEVLGWEPIYNTTFCAAIQPTL